MFNSFKSFAIMDAYDLQARHAPVVFAALPRTRQPGQQRKRQ
jgi:hypothetical protein